MRHSLKVIQSSSEIRLKTQCRLLLYMSDAVVPTVVEHVSTTEMRTKLHMVQTCKMRQTPPKINEVQHNKRRQFLQSQFQEPEQRFVRRGIMVALNSLESPGEYHCYTKVCNYSIRLQHNHDGWHSVQENKVRLGLLNIGEYSQILQRWSPIVTFPCYEVFMHFKDIGLLPHKSIQTTLSVRCKHSPPLAARTVLFAVS